MASDPRRRDGKARGRDPHGPYWIYGAHAVRAALGNPARRIRRVLATGETAATLPADAMPERAGPEAIAALLPPGAVHQGLAALVDPLRPPPLAEVLAASPGPVLVLDQVTDPRNVGAILRSAAAFGAAAVIVQDRHAPLEGGAMARAAAGALEHIPLLRAVNLARTLQALKQAGLWVVGLDAGAAGPLDAAALADRRLALVLGAEDEGMRRLTREACDLTVRLPQTRAVESLNVSVAAAVALYAVQAARPERAA
jgi:23S rRNA (guanosine2251-2'-O)-methyltransferase